MQVGLVLCDWIEFNLYAYLKRPPLRSLSIQPAAHTHLWRLPHVLSSSLPLFSLGVPHDPPLGHPKFFHAQGYWVSSICWFLILGSSTSKGERQEKRRRRRSKKEIKSWSWSRLHLDPTGWIFFKKKFNLKRAIPDWSWVDDYRGRTLVWLEKNLFSSIFWF